VRRRPDCRSGGSAGRLKRFNPPAKRSRTR
jgi:hypothetical protein